MGRMASITSRSSRLRVSRGIGDAIKRTNDGNSDEPTERLVSRGFCHRKKKRQITSGAHLNSFCDLFGYAVAASLRRIAKMTINAPLIIASVDAASGT